jgi:hypothetical protein
VRHASHRFCRGLGAEVLDDGITGFIVHSVDEAVAATEQALTLDRARCRAVFEARFTARRMAEDSMSRFTEP